jgi:phage pi2 protein 07
MERWKVQKFTGDGAKEFEVDAEWLKGVDRVEDIKSLVLHKDTKERLEVEYNGGDIVFYENVFGSWGFPTVLN